MALSSKLKADYVELINQQLDHIPMPSIEEFNLVNEALINIVSPRAGYSIPEALRERIFDISDLLDSPEDYVESKEDYAEYQQIIRDRINAKVLELQSCNEKQKEAYIKAHKERKTAAAQYQQQIAGRQAPQPGSNAHTLTQEQWLAEQQAIFSRNGTLSGIQLLAPPSGNAEMLRRIQALSQPPELNSLNQALLQAASPNRESIASTHSQILSNLEAARYISYDFGTPRYQMANPQNLPLGADWHGRVQGPQRDLGLATQLRFFSGRQQNTAQRALELTQELTISPAVRLGLLNNRITTNPDDLGARLERAHLPSVQNSVALQDYNYILEREPENVAALLGRATLNEDEATHGYDLGEGEAALADYRHVLEIEPQNQIALDGVERLAPSAPPPSNNALTEADLLAQIQNLFAADSERVNIMEATENITDQIYEVVGSSNTRFANWGLIHFLDHLLANNPNLNSLLELSLALKVSYLDETSIQQQISDAVTLSDRLFTEDDLRNVNTECLYEITAPNALRALRDGRTTIDLLTQLDVTELHNANATNEYPAPPQPNP